MRVVSTQESLNVLSQVRPEPKKFILPEIILILVVVFEGDLYLCSVGFDFPVL